MIAADRPSEVVESLYDVLVDELNSEASPSALLAIFVDEGKNSLRIRVGHPRGAKWYRLIVEEFDPTVRPPGVPVRLLPGK